MLSAQYATIILDVAYATCALQDRNPLQLQVGLRPKLLAALKSSPADGVDPNSVEERRSVFGTNEYDHPPGASYLQLVWEQLKDPTILLLVAAATVLCSAHPISIMEHFVL